MSVKLEKTPKLRESETPFLLSQVAHRGPRDSPAMQIPYSEIHAVLYPLAKYR